MQPIFDCMSKEKNPSQDVLKQLYSSNKLNSEKLCKNDIFQLPIFAYGALKL